MACEELGALAVILREWPGVGAFLQIENTERWVEPDGRTEHGLDAVRLHALATVEARVVDRGRAHDGSTGRQRLGDDAARDRGTCPRHVCLREPSADPPEAPRVICGALVAQLDVATSGHARLENERERFLKKRLESLVASEVEKLAVEVTLGPEGCIPRFVLDHCHARSLRPARAPRQRPAAIRRRRPATDQARSQAPCGPVAS